MLTRFNDSSLSLGAAHRIICRSLFLLLSLSMMMATVLAQADEAAESKAENASNEASALVEKGTKEALQQSVSKFEEARSLYHSLGDRDSESQVLTGLGIVFNMLGEKQKALDYMQQALKIAREVGSREGQATTLLLIGRVYSSLGENQKALDAYFEALPLFQGSELSEEAFLALNNIGLVYQTEGEGQKALDYFFKALELSRKTDDKRNQGAVLSNLGNLYLSIGDGRKALEYLMPALTLLHQTGNQRGEALTLNNIAFSYYLLNETQQAEEYFARALKLARRTGDREAESTTLNNQAQLLSDRGELVKALEVYVQVLRLSKEIGFRYGEARVLNNIGELFIQLKRIPPAIENLNDALKLSREIKDRHVEAEALLNLASIEKERGNLKDALPLIEAAIALTESLRLKFDSGELRSTYFSSVQDYYEFYIDLLMRLNKQQPTAGYDGLALKASERARARALLETLAEANADIRKGIDPALLERERSLQQQLNLKAHEQMTLPGTEHTDEQARLIAQEVETLTTEFQRVEAEIRQKSPGYAALTQPQPLALKEIQTEVLDANTLLLEYSLGEEHSYLWAVTPASIASYELPGRDEIEAAARRVYELLNARNRRVNGETPAQRQARLSQADAQYPEAAALLSRLALAPVAAELKDKRLLIVSDGTLQYIPFAALPEPSTAANPQPLVVKHEIVSLPSVSTLAVLRKEVKDRKPAAKTIAVLADPVFEASDARVKKPAAGVKAGNAVQANAASATRILEHQYKTSATESGVADNRLSIPRLPGTRQEALQILSLVPPAESKQALDFNASRETVMDADLSQYRYVHFATHGFLNSTHPELSGIVLSMFNERGEAQDGFLRAHEVFNLKLPAELIVLSACQTGLGKEIKGEGLVGLTRGFMYAGAPRVVVSLWSVSDAATAELMALFYRGMLKDGLRPAEALRAAQVSLMKEQKWQSPYYWAAFTLQGEWR